MTPETIWVVVPLSRPKNLPGVLANFARQDFSGKRLVIVENGAALGACATRGIAPDMLLTSEPHQSVAKNEALAAIRRRGGGFWTTFDDDDWYGRGHLSELAANAERTTVVGRQVHFVRLSDGLYLFNSGKQSRASQSVCGPTISCWAEDAVEYPKVSPSDDQAWCRAMAAAGATFWSCSERHFVYSRVGDDHVWRASDVIVRRQYGDARFFGDASNEIVDQLDPPPSVLRPAPNSAELFETMRSTTHVMRQN